MKQSKLLVLIVMFLCLGSSGLAAQGQIWVLDIKGVIGPAVADYMVRGLEQAEAEGASMVVLTIDTPGGLDTSMRQMVQAILAADIPVVGYVSPRGARAASAGTYMLYACHVAAMAPATNLGAATPVQMQSPSLPSMPGEESGDGAAQDADQNNPSSSQQPQPGSAMERKMVNDATAYIEGLAELRGRNKAWARQAVTQGASLPAEEALQKNVIDLMAGNLNNLLEQLHGKQIALDDTTSITLTTEGVAIHPHPVDWRSEFLAIITNPNIAYMLVMIGIYGLIFEFSNPGLGLPGIAGAVCLLLALYAFQVLPVSYAGLGLIVLGVALMTAEAFAPSFGVLGLGGVVAFAIGSIILMDTDLPGYQIAMPLVAGFTAFSALLLVVALGLVLKSSKSKVVTGLSTLMGETAKVVTLHDGVAYVHLQGERWQVKCLEPLAVNDRVRVTRASGLVLQVEKINTEESEL